MAIGAVLGSTTVPTSAAVTLTKTIAMTTLQKAIVATVVAGTLGVGLYQAHLASNLRKQVQALKQQQEGLTALSDQAQDLQRERDRATNALAALVTEDALGKKGPNEVLKLRGEVGRLRQENAQISSTNALSKATANPEARKILRDTQKLGMGTIYKAFAQKMKLAPDQTDKLNDLLADHIMNDVDHVTTMLRDKPAPEQMDTLFATEDASLQQQVEDLLGQDGLAQYQDYTKNLLSTLTAAQFKSLLTGTETEKAQKSNQLRQAIQTSAQAALADAGLPANYQAVPMLNFRNIASEQAAEQSLKLLDDIYQRTAAAGSGFLTAEEIAKFQDFKDAALNSSRGAITLNRTMMAPISN
jgi:hypothetical protein